MQIKYGKRILAGLGLAMTLAVPWAAATNYYVVTSSQQPSPTPPWTNWGWAHTNLIEVVTYAGDNDTVYVTNNAKYYLTNQITILNAITVRSWGPDGILDPTNTILDGNYPTTTNRHFTLRNDGATLAGFTLTNGWGSSDSNAACGGAILLQRGIVTNCIIMHNYALSTNADYNQAGGGGIDMGIWTTDKGGVWNCTISGNVAYKSGGGILQYRGGPWWIVNCTISGNSASGWGGGNSGGGIYANPVDLNAMIISNCWIVSNYSTAYGGGMYMGYYAQCHNSIIMANTIDMYYGGGIRLGGYNLIRNCLIVNNVNKTPNSPAGGGGISCDGTRCLVQNCTIASNTVPSMYGGGVYLKGAATLKSFENTIIWGNSAGNGSSSNYYLYSTAGTNTFTNCCTSPQIVSIYATEVNTITNDPKFMSIVNTDFRLQSDSPCINVGVNRDWMEGAKDLSGTRRIDHFRRTVDIGAYEYLGKGTLFGFQ